MKTPIQPIHVTMPTCGASVNKDLYKEFHLRAYHPDVTEVYSNFTNRNGKYAPDNVLGGVINVGPQYVVKSFLMKDWDETFFNMTKSSAVRYHKRLLSAMVGYQVDTKYLEDLHDLGYLPLEVKTVEEGTIVPYGVPSLTVKSTLDGFQWLTNAIETALSCELWGIQTSATTAANYKLNFLSAAMIAGIDEEFTKYQAHDFSMRGMFGMQAAAMSGFGHLTSSYGTDTGPAVDFAERWYGANVDKEVVGCGVNATEHSVTCSWQKEGELVFLDYLMDEVAPTGILSIVADTWDFWHLVTVLLPQRKDKILARDGSIVIRPDSGDPVEILCGIAPKDRARDMEGNYVRTHRTKDGMGNTSTVFGAVVSEAEVKGLMECLWDTFGGTVNDRGFKVLDPHISAIYGDSITIERQLQIQKRLLDKGIAPTMVLGIGSYTYQYVTRDTHGSAIKATSIVKAGQREAIFKDPKTDPGKKSAKGLLMVIREDGKLVVVEDVTEEQEASDDNLLKTIFLNGKLVKETTLAEIRKVVHNQLEKLL